MECTIGIQDEDGGILECEEQAYSQCRQICEMEGIDVSVKVRQVGTPYKLIDIKSQGNTMATIVLKMDKGEIVVVSPLISDALIERSQPIDIPKVVITLKQGRKPHDLRESRSEKIK